jgi:radical SAM superfamily enzyme YgiQ (UPF0313 family)
MYKRRSKDALQPLFASAIAANTPKDIEIKLFDDRLEDIPFDETVDLVGISIETFNALRSYEIASEYRKKGAKVIAGGFHPTIMPDEVSQYTDSIFSGDIENGWQEVITDLQNGTLKKRYGGNLPNGNIVKFDRSIITNKQYGPIEMVQWGRGCPFNCDFCSIKAFYKSKQSCRPLDDLVVELASLKNKTVFFVDDNLYHDKDQFRAFLKAITPLKLKWTCQISINIANDEDLLKLMKESGCFLVLIGIESFNKDNLKLMNKSWNNKDISIETAIKKVIDQGLLIYGTFIFGYDYDNQKSFEESVNFAIRNKFFIANFNPLYPMPGTSLYSRLKLENRLLFDKWWLDPDFYYGKTMYQPKSMTPQELEDRCYEAKLEFNSWKSIIHRGLSFNITSDLKNIVLYLMVNYTNRREIFRKQGKKLGG